MDAKVIRRRRFSSESTMITTKAAAPNTARRLTPVTSSTLPVVTAMPPDVAGGVGVGGDGVGAGAGGGVGVGVPHAAEVGNVMRAPHCPSSAMANVALGGHGTPLEQMKSNATVRGAPFEHRSPLLTVSATPLLLLPLLPLLLLLLLLLLSALQCSGAAHFAAIAQLPSWCVIESSAADPGAPHVPSVGAHMEKAYVSPTHDALAVRPRSAVKLYSRLPSEATHGGEGGAGEGGGAGDGGVGVGGGEGGGEGDGGGVGVGASPQHDHTHVSGCFCSSSSVQLHVFGSPPHACSTSCPLDPAALHFDAHVLSLTMLTALHFPNPSHTT